MEGIIALTYRCNARCHMCNIWQHPTRISDEITAEDLKKLPGGFKFLNITGGEPFLREDMEEVIRTVRPKTKRLVISTNGYYTEKILNTAEKFRDIGFRISLEGLPSANDQLRGLEDGFDHGLRTLLKLSELGIKDIGFGITVSDRNARDMNELYSLAKMLGVEFATAAVHNTYYFHKFDNEIREKELVTEELNRLAERMLKSGRPKEWFRAYFNHGLANYVCGGKRLLPCGMGRDVFFLDPFGELRPCNGMEATMGNLKNSSFEEIWNGPQADDVRRQVFNCDKNCWMVGSASPAMKKYILKPVKWIMGRKLGLHRE